MLLTLDRGFIDGLDTVTNLKIKLTVNDIDPLILVVMEMARPAGSARGLENTHRAVCVLCRHFAINWSVAEFGLLAKTVVPRGHVEARKHLFIFHFLCSFQVLDCFIDGFNQLARSREVLLQNLPMFHTRSEDSSAEKVTKPFLEGARFFRILYAAV